MNPIRLFSTTVLTLIPCLLLPAMADEETLRLPLRLHLVTDIEMVREVAKPNGTTHKTRMDMPVTVADAKVMMAQVNDIWAPAGIEWVTDPEAGGGGIIREKAAGGRLPQEPLDTLAKQVVARERGSQVNYMSEVFPRLADPANNETIGDDGRFNRTKPEMYHLYLLPYVGQTLQGTATISGNFAIVGVFSDKAPNRKGYPKPRTHVIPAKTQPTLTISNFPKAGALSATIAHELGHNLSLLHVDEGMKDNLMKGHVKLRLGPTQITKARAQAMKGPLLGKLDVSPGSPKLSMETLSGEGVWISPLPPGYPSRGGPLRVTVWFETQFLGDGMGYERRSKEFADAGRREMRTQVVKVLKNESMRSHREADAVLQRLLKDKTIDDLDRHWIVNGFSCTISKEDLPALTKVPGVRKIFLRAARTLPSPPLPEVAPVPDLPGPDEPSYENLPWYIEKLKADQVWRDFGVAGEGTLNVIHDRNFIASNHLARSIYRNPDEIPGNGIDDDLNGYVDDVHGYNFDRQSPQLHTQSFSGDPKDRRVLHGTSCANIVCGAGSESGIPQVGVAPLGRWAGVINLGGIERSVEWAIEQGADTYSMSFSRRKLGEYQSHWRKVMEHGAFCGVFFVSGAGNVERGDESPFLMNIPQNIPNAVFAAAGVQKDLSKTPFSCIGPVEWNTEHYQDGIVQKPEVCAFNIDVPCLLPDGSVVENLLRGNSYAGPMFCGTISLMLSADPDLLPWDLQEIITTTATDVGPPGVDHETGHGLINCHAAVKETLRRKALRNSR